MFASTVKNRCRRLLADAGSPPHPAAAPRVHALAEMNCLSEDEEKYIGKCAGVQWLSASLTADGPDFFFEIMVDVAAAGGTAIGFAHAECELGVDMVGFEADSYGYHSNDGGVVGNGYHYAEETSGAHPPIWTAGDRVGCGYKVASQSIYFTKNGSRVGIIPDIKITKPLYPTLTSIVDKTPAVLHVVRTCSPETESAPAAQNCMAAPPMRHAIASSALPLRFTRASAEYAATPAGVFDSWAASMSEDELEAELVPNLEAILHAANPEWSAEEMADQMRLYRDSLSGNDQNERGEDIAALKIFASRCGWASRYEVSDDILLELLKTVAAWRDTSPSKLKQALEARGHKNFSKNRIKKVKTAALQDEDDVEDPDKDDAENWELCLDQTEVSDDILVELLNTVVGAAWRDTSPSKLKQALEAAGHKNFSKNRIKKVKTAALQDEDEAEDDDEGYENMDYTQHPTVPAHVVEAATAAVALLLDAADQSEEECMVCMQPTPSEERRKIGLPCTHTMCNVCLEEMAQTAQSNCPKCRSSFLPPPAEGLQCRINLPPPVPEHGGKNSGGKGSAHVPVRTAWDLVKAKLHGQTCVVVEISHSSAICKLDDLLMQSDGIIGLHSLSLPISSLLVMSANSRSVSPAERLAAAPAKLYSTESAPVGSLLPSPVTGSLQAQVPPRKAFLLNVHAPAFKSQVLVKSITGEPKDQMLDIAKDCTSADLINTGRVPLGSKFIGHDGEKQRFLLEDEPVLSSCRLNKDDFPVLDFRPPTVAESSQLMDSLKESSPRLTVAEDSMKERSPLPSPVDDVHPFAAFQAFIEATGYDSLNRFLGVEVCDLVDLKISQHDLGVCLACMTKDDPVAWPALSSEAKVMVRNIGSLLDLNAGKSSAPKIIKSSAGAAAECAVVSKEKSLHRLAEMSKKLYLDHSCHQAAFYGASSYQDQFINFLQEFTTFDEERRHKLGVSLSRNVLAATSEKLGGDAYDVARISMYQRNPPNYFQAKMYASKSVDFTSVGAKAIDEQLQDSLIIDSSNEEEAEKRRFQLCNKRDSLSEIAGKSERLLREVNAAELSARRDELADEFTVTHQQELNEVRNKSSVLSQEKDALALESNDIAKIRHSSVQDHLKDGNWTEKPGSGRGGHKVYMRTVIMVDEPYSRQKQKVTIASTPSDWRGSKNALQELRRQDEGVLVKSDKVSEDEVSEESLEVVRKIAVDDHLKKMHKLNEDRKMIALELTREEAAMRDLWAYEWTDVYTDGN